MISTPGIVLHTTPYGDTSVIVKVFTRQLGVQPYIIKGVRGRNAKVKQNLLQPLSCLDMVVYDNPKSELNYVKELTPRHNESLEQSSNQAITHSLRFFMTEVLYKSLQEAEPMPALYDHVDGINSQLSALNAQFPITFLLTVARHLGIEPLDNYCTREPLFDIQEGSFVSAPTETTLSNDLSAMLHEYLRHYNIPVCYDFPVGHAHLRNFPLLTGAKATLEITPNGVILRYTEGAHKN